MKLMPNVSLSSDMHVLTYPWYTSWTRRIRSSLEVSTAASRSADSGSSPSTARGALQELLQSESFRVSAIFDLPPLGPRLFRSAIALNIASWSP